MYIHVVPKVRPAIFLTHFWTKLQLRPANDTGNARLRSGFWLRLNRSWLDAIVFRLCNLFLFWISVCNRALKRR